MRLARGGMLVLALAGLACSQKVTAPKTTGATSGGTTSGTTTSSSGSSGTGSSSGSSGTTGGGPCSATSDCTGAQVCVVGTCRDPGSVALAGACTASRDCQSGLYCSPIGQCAPAGTGAADAACTTDADCSAGLRCLYTGLSGSCGAAGTGEQGQACSAQSDCLAGLFCSSGANGSSRTCEPYPAAFPAYTGPDCADDDGGLRVYFEVPRPGAYPRDFFRLPYPNDIRVTDGGLDLSDFPTPGVGPADVDLVALYRDALVADFDGFSTIAPVTFRFSGTIDLGGIAAAVKVVDLTAPSDTSAFFYEYTFIINGNHYNCPNRLTVGPGEQTPLRAGHTYAVLLMSGLQDASGHPVRADADLLSVLASSPPADAALQHAWDAYAPLRSWLSANSVAASSVVGVSVFTVGRPLSSMAALSQAVASEPGLSVSDVAVCGSGQTSSCDALGADHACAPASNDFYEIHGRMRLPIYQQGTEPYLTPAQGGAIAMDGGSAVKQRDEDVCFALTVPKSAAPANGWPLVITHHGTGGSMTDFIHSGVAAQLATAAAPLAVLGFDAVEHADRRGSSTEKPDNLVFNVLNPRAARDNFLQGAADILSEAKFSAVSIGADGGAPITFDSSHVYFFGHSQGSTSGELALPFLDAAPTAILSGASAHLTQSLLHKSSPVDAKAGIAFLIQEDPSQLDTEHPVLGLFQNFFDRADPLNANGAIVRAPLAGHAPHNVFMTWGTGDTYTPEGTLQANLVSLGIPVAGAVLEGNVGAPVSRPVSQNINVGSGSVTAAAAQYAPPSGSDGHFVAFEVPGAVSDWTAFIQSDLASGRPTLP